MVGRPLVPAPPTVVRQQRELDKRPGTGDWQTLTHRLLDEAKQGKQSSQQLRDLMLAVKKTGDRQVHDHQSVVNGELKRKVAQTRSLKARLEKQLVATTQELVLQIQERARTKERLDARRRPLRVAEARTRERLERPSAEQINDAVDRTLRQETQELRSSTEQLVDLVKTSGELIARLEHSKRLLQADLLDKTQSLELDLQCLEVRQTDGLSAMQSMMNESATMVAQRAPNLPHKWKTSTVQLIAESSELEQRSARLRKAIQKAVQAVQISNAQAKLLTDDALRTKVKQTNALHTQLLDNLRAVNAELDELLRNRDQIQRTLDLKQGPLNVIRQRLAIRKRRPEREAVRDSVEEALEEELRKLKGTMDSLQDKLLACNAEASRLETLKRQLELDCRNKGFALQHDRRALQIDVNQVRSDWGGSDAVSQQASARSGCSLPSIRSTPRATVTS
eukprot:TRINITY_DN7704_c0_g1_i1.p1 TRINITY_DN7704_c0_g1~~TRINITY_DN7704_c0_g1_i1.p1  ORF type:complete len:502 (+),score=208.78 TRINITY_DN7704_c0_g1_i1:154-1506(+)